MKLWRRIKIALLWAAPTIDEMREADIKEADRCVVIAAGRVDAAHYNLVKQRSEFRAAEARVEFLHDENEPKNPLYRPTYMRKVN